MLFSCTHNQGRYEVAMDWNFVGRERWYNFQWVKASSSSASKTMDEKGVKRALLAWSEVLFCWSTILCFKCFLVYGVCQGCGNAYKCWGWRCEDPPPMSSWCMSRKCSCSFQNAAITWQRVFVVVKSSKEEGIILALNSYCIKVGFFLFWHHLSHLLGWTTCCEFLLQLDTFL